jgi:hypothetical protein
MPEEALHRHFNEMQERTALSLYGRNMYEVMKYWDAPSPESPELAHEYARAWQGTPKVVFSTTLESVGPTRREPAAALHAAALPTEEALSLTARGKKLFPCVRRCALPPYCMVENARES